MIKSVISYLKVLLLTVAGLFSACSSQETGHNESEADFCAHIHPDDSPGLSRALADITDSMRTKTGIYVLEEGANSMIGRAWLSENAEKTIDIQYFIFSTDNVGLIACDYLVRAADRGVKVRIIVDDIMVDAPLEDVLMLDSHENIDIKIYNPGTNLGKNLLSKLNKVMTDFRSFNQRMHNKTFIVDGKVVITGGRNIADEYFDYDHEYNFRDRDVLLLGKSTKQVGRSFEEFWQSDLSVPVSEISPEFPEISMDENRFEKLHQYACNPDNFWPQVRNKIADLPQAFAAIKKELIWLANVSFISDVPGKNEETVSLSGGGITTDSLIALVKKAKKTVDIQTPYLITTELSKGLFREAVERGVRVRILTNSLASTDNLEAFSAYQSDREALLQTGVHIFEFRPDAAIRRRMMTGELHTTLDHQPRFGLHAKTMVVDGRTVVIGTFNLDPRSANLNTECLAVIRSEAVANSVLKIMEQEFEPENAWETTLTFNPDSVAGKVKQIKTWTRKVLPKEVL